MIEALSHVLTRHDVTWETYEALLREFAGRRMPRFTYHQGTLEIRHSLTLLHETTRLQVERIVEAVADAQERDIEAVGSITLKSKAAESGFEPDSGFYIQNAEEVADSGEIDLSAGDPAPDLVIEVDVTSPSLHRLPVMAALGVTEVWRWLGGTVTILGRTEEGFTPRSTSAVLPPLTAAALNELLGKSRRLRRRAWLAEVRDWARQNSGNDESRP